VVDAVPGSTDNNEASRHESGTDQEHERIATSPTTSARLAAAPSTSHAAPTLSQHRLHIEPGRLQRGQKPEQHTDDARGTERERQHAQIDRNGIESRMFCGRSATSRLVSAVASTTPTNPPAREDDASTASGALAFPCLLERPNGHLAPPAFGAREQKAGNVRARSAGRIRRRRGARAAHEPADDTIEQRDGARRNFIFAG
jgi:hypothetical protein